MDLKKYFWGEGKISIQRRGYLRVNIEVILRRTGFSFLKMEKFFFETKFEENLNDIGY